MSLFWDSPWNRWPTNDDNMPKGGVYTMGSATHYGPFPAAPGFSEAGYRPNDVGVGCSNGQPGGDPHWNNVLKDGLLINPLDPLTVWPRMPTVAVAEAVWGGVNKGRACWATLSVRNADDPTLSFEAVIVDFCPTVGCNWNVSSRGHNVDVYGQESWYALGGNALTSEINVEIMWPTLSGASPLFARSCFYVLFVLLIL